MTENTDEQQEMMSVESEGVLAFVRTKDGTYVYGARSFVIAMVIVVAFVAVSVVAMVRGTEQLQMQAFSAMQALAIAAITWFAISKSKGGT